MVEHIQTSTSLIILRHFSKCPPFSDPALRGVYHFEGPISIFIVLVRPHSVCDHSLCKLTALDRQIFHTWCIGLIKSHRSAAISKAKPVNADDEFEWCPLCNCHCIEAEVLGTEKIFILYGAVKKSRVKPSREEPALHLGSDDWEDSQPVFIATSVGCHDYLNPQSEPSSISTHTHLFDQRKAKNLTFASSMLVAPLLYLGAYWSSSTLHCNTRWVLIANETFLRDTQATFRTSTTACNLYTSSLIT